MSQCGVGLMQQGSPQYYVIHSNDRMVVIGRCFLIDKSWRTFFFLCIANIFLSAGTASFCLLPFFLHGRKTTISCAPAILVNHA